jgi:hypothetical protein
MQQEQAEVRKPTTNLLHLQLLSAESKNRDTDRLQLVADLFPGTAHAYAERWRRHRITTLGRDELGHWAIFSCGIRMNLSQLSPIEPFQSVRRTEIPADG